MTKQQCKGQILQDLVNKDYVFYLWFWPWPKNDKNGSLDYHSDFPDDMMFEKY